MSDGHEKEMGDVDAEGGEPLGLEEAAATAVPAPRGGRRPRGDRKRESGASADAPGMGAGEAGVVAGSADEGGIGAAGADEAGVVAGSADEAGIGAAGADEAGVVAAGTDETGIGAAGAGEPGISGAGANEPTKGRAETRTSRRRHGGRETAPRVGTDEPGMGGAATPSEVLLRVREVAVEILDRLGAQAEIEVRDTAEAIVGTLRITGGASVMDAAPRRQVLEAIQYLTGRIVQREEGRKRIVLELEGAPTLDEDPALAEMGRRLGEAAKRMGKSLTVVPMHARDRRAIHLALENMPGVHTRSEGEGNLRRLVIEPVAERPGADEPVSG